MPESTAIAFRAPGKVVVWGEYAVLAGAPAGVMAIDRYAQVNLLPRQRNLSFRANGPLTPHIHCATHKFIDADITRMAEVILKHWGYADWPSGALVDMDTHAFYQSGRKYGLGSSAALCVALYNCLAEQLSHPPTLREAMEIHRTFQGGRGSGLDVAASWHGSTILFTQGEIAPFVWPQDLYWRLIWTGHSAATAVHLDRFAQWREAGRAGALDDLVLQSRRVAEAPGLERLHEYVANLREFDAQSQLNIFTHEHAMLATMAARTQLVYKPCGAGGGDIGIAMSRDPQALAHFVDQAINQDFVVLQSEIAPNGVEHCA
jgi:phosphomevalonate kinase